MIRKIIILLIIVLFMCTCKKSNDDQNNAITLAGVVNNWDTKAPIANVRVYVSASLLFPPVDSATSDLSGRVSFTYPTGTGIRILWPKDPAYINSVAIFNTTNTGGSRTDTLYLMRPSYLQVNLHRANAYQASDEINLRVNGYRLTFSYPPPIMGLSQFYNNSWSANVADTIVNIPMAYFPTPYQKAYIDWKVSRNNIAITSQADSVDLIQYGTKNYQLNY